jgi:protein-S-isoprenylcysteine O-methyltransferase Ste14
MIRLNRVNVRLVLWSSIATFLYLAVLVWAWGDWRSFFAHPARLSAVVAMVVLVVAIWFSGASGLSPGIRESRGSRRIFVPLILITVAMVWFPPFADRRNLWTLDGDTVRYTGLLLFLIGGTIRTASIFALEHRFSGFVAVQANHKLKTDGIYRFIRHPSYMGALLAMIGLVLIFRSGVALLLIPLMLLVILHRIKDEEEFLQSEFGAEYTDYRRRTWRLFPFIY